MIEPWHGCHGVEGAAADGERRDEGGHMTGLNGRVTSSNVRITSLAVPPPLTT